MESDIRQEIKENHKYRSTETTNEQSANELEEKEEQDVDSFAIQADKDKDTNSPTIERIK